jgi:hypothetical protein
MSIWTSGIATGVAVGPGVGVTSGGGDAVGFGFAVAPEVGVPVLRGVVGVAASVGVAVAPTVGAPVLPETEPCVEDTRPVARIVALEA